jgi:hypothetical protein
MSARRLKADIGPRVMEDFLLALGHCCPSFVRATTSQTIVADLPIPN